MGGPTYKPLNSLTSSRSLTPRASATLVLPPQPLCKKKKDQVTLAAPSLASDAARLSAGALPVDKAALLDMYEVRTSVLY